MSTAQHPGPRPGMHTVHILCALHLVARRLGCTMRIHEPSAELRELLDLAGVAGALLGTDEVPGPDPSP